MHIVVGIEIGKRGLVKLHPLIALIDGRKLPERAHLVGYTDNRRSMTTPMGRRGLRYYVLTHPWQYLWYADTGEEILDDVTV